MTYDVRAEELKQVYPEQQHFDYETLAPLNDATRHRIAYLRTVPMLWERGDSFLDIGCAKGLIAHLVADTYDAITAYEPDPELYRLALSIAAHRGNKKIAILRGDHRSIPLMTQDKNAECAKIRLQNQYTTVWAGDVNHYFVNIGFAAGAPWLWIEKLKSLAKNYIVLDGPLLAVDFAVQKLAAVHGWPTALVAEYNTCAMAAKMLPQFEVVHRATNERNRNTMVFKRVKDDLDSMPVYPDFIARLQGAGTDIATNLRPPWSVVKMDGNRYKFDVGCLPPGVLQLLNHCPYFPETRAVLRNPDGVLVGDVCPWLTGTAPTQYIDLLPDWLKMNVALSSVGLFEPGYRLSNFLKPAGGSRYIDLDYDMINNTAHYAADLKYKEEWKKIGLLFTEELYAKQDRL